MRLLITLLITGLLTLGCSKGTPEQSTFGCSKPSKEEAPEPKVKAKPLVTTLEEPKMEATPSENGINVKITAPKFGDTIKTVTLAWDANTEDDLAGYRLYYGDSPRPDGVTGPDTTTYSTSVDIPNPVAVTYEIQLPVGAYFFALTAYDTSENESGFSNEAFANLLDAPTNFEVSFNWSAYTQTDDVDGYRIYYGDTSRGTVYAPYESNPYSNVIEIPGPMLVSYSTSLPAGDYYFSMTAYNSIYPEGYQDSPFSNEVYASIGLSDLFPETPGSITLTPIL